MGNVSQIYFFISDKPMMRYIALMLLHSVMKFLVKIDSEICNRTYFESGTIQSSRNTTVDS